MLGERSAITDLEIDYKLPEDRLLVRFTVASSGLAHRERNSRSPFRFGRELPSNSLSDR